MKIERLKLIKSIQQDLIELGQTFELEYTELKNHDVMQGEYISSEHKLVLDFIEQMNQMQGRVQGSISIGEETAISFIKNRSKHIEDSLIVKQSVINQGLLLAWYDGKIEGAQDNKACHLGEIDAYKEECKKQIETILRMNKL